MVFFSKRPQRLKEPVQVSTLTGFLPRDLRVSPYTPGPAPGLPEILPRTELAAGPLAEMPPHPVNTRDFGMRGFGPGMMQTYNPREIHLLP